MRSPSWLVATIALASSSLSWSAPAPDANPLRLTPDHATASVADLDREAAWYERIMGFHEVGRHREADFEIRRLAIPGYRIDLVWQRGSSRPANGKGSAIQGWFHIVFRTDDFDGDYRRLRELGTDVQSTSIPASSASRLLFHDPEGNELEIVSNQPPPAG